MSESKWKYATCYLTANDLPTNKSIEAYLNAKAKKGFELVQILEQKLVYEPTKNCAYTFIFKQAITKATKGQQP